VITVPYANYTPEEVVSRGEAIYKEQIRDIVEAENKGKFVVIDIETGDYEIDVDDLRVTMRALAKRPAAILYGLRIGYPTAYRLGGRFRLHVAAGNGRESHEAE
jgi:hypothetical protein